jgi:predicted subunit of tRNA(5-methylaminomethyl-2-thiouridylate) methyltransferase
MKAVTIKYMTDGKTSLVHGPDVPAKEQLKYIKKLKLEGLPDKVDLVELWSRADGFRAAAKTSKKDMEASRKVGEKAKADYIKKQEELKEKELKSLKEQKKKLEASKKETDNHIAALKKKNQKKEDPQAPKK